MPMTRVSLRVRLAALIGILLVVCGAALLTISYELVSSNLSGPTPTKLTGKIRTAPTSATQRHNTKGTPSQAGASNVARAVASGPSAGPKGTPGAGPKGAEQSELRNQTLDRLLTQYLAVLAGVVLVALVLGWLLAGRLLRAIRKITSVAERVTGRNLNERIGLEGPRDELRELGDTVDRMFARLDATFSTQRRFIADASHELRTPLSAMRTEIEVLAADPHAAAADVAAATRVLRRQLARSEQLIEALVALARSEPELLVREPVDLAQIARDALDDAASQMADQGLRVEQQLAPAVVHGDRRLLTLLVRNLLDNAIKHNHDGGWISLRTAVEANTVRLAVANSGHLVAAEEVHELTQAFRRGGRARVGDGHGLGLAIVQAVARAHHGTMIIERENHGGLRIEVRLPLALTKRADTPVARDRNDANTSQARSARPACDTGTAPEARPATAPTSSVDPVRTR
jgi:signal transduction histidine kinase